MFFVLCAFRLWHTCFGHDGGRDAMPEHQHGCVIDSIYTIVSKFVKVNCSTLIWELDKCKGVYLVTLSAQAFGMVPLATVNHIL